MYMCVLWTSRQRRVDPSTGSERSPDRKDRTDGKLEPAECSGKLFTHRHVTKTFSESHMTKVEKGHLEDMY